MPIPNAQQLMIPYLRIIEDGAEYHRVKVRDKLIDELKLTDEERNEPLPSGLRPKINDRISWANTLLAKSRLLERPTRGCVRITKEGRDFLSLGLQTVDRKTLMKFPGIIEWGEERRRDGQAGEEPQDHEMEMTPEERIAITIKEHRDALGQSLLEVVRSCSYGFFERLVVKLLVRMGYGGSESDAISKVVGKSGDGGIDGFIQEDVLGLGSIYVQAKRYAENNVVTPSAIRDFSGSLDQHGAKKGVFITTSRFSDDARKFVETARTDKKIVLVDGNRLADLMIEFGIGITISQTFQIKRIDSDFFEEE